MTPETHLHRLRDGLMPESGQQDRVRATIQARIGHAHALESLKNTVQPTPDQHRLVWGRVLQGIDVPNLSSLLDRVRSIMDPSQAEQLLMRAGLISRLAPVEVRTSYVWTKRVAAFALVLIALRASPVLFLAPHTIAQSAVIVVPTKGVTEVSLHGLWQPIVGEITLQEGVQLRTGDGQATVLLHDDGTIRLDTYTTIAMHDLTDRPEPALDGPTLTLTDGRVWVQGLLPRTMRGLTVATPFGDVTVHDGSVSLAVDEGALSVRVWDRHAVVSMNGEDITLIAGEKQRFGQDSAGQVTSITDAEYDDPWVSQNLQRDAVHQREIAQMQQERRAAEAGILPTSVLYPVKRVAEQVDVLFTLDPQAKVQKQLDLASTRLNEAAAMIAEGSEGSEVPLEEYKQTLIAVATGSGGDSVTQFLVRQTVAENTAELSASLPGDQSYVLKRTVMETGTELPDPAVSAAEVEEQILIDTLDVLHVAINAGDTTLAQETYNDVEEYLSTLDDDAAPALKKEVLSILENVAVTLQQSGTAASSGTLATQLETYLPKEEEEKVEPLTDAQIDEMIADMLHRIFVFDHQRSQWNQMQYEIVQIQDHPDAVRILRRLYQALPPDLASYVRTAIREVQ